MREDNLALLESNLGISIKKRRQRKRDLMHFLVIVCNIYQPMRPIRWILNQILTLIWIKLDGMIQMTKLAEILKNWSIWDEINKINLCTKMKEKSKSIIQINIVIPCSSQSINK